MEKEQAREKIGQLVKEFSEIPKSHLDSMPEEDIKRIFITPLLECLGWNKFDILSEARVLKGRADYILKNGNQELLVVEAKKTNVSLTEEEGRQAVSYAYHRKIKFSVLTNFKYIRVYHALSNIKNIDKNLLRVNNDYFRLGFEEFLDKFDILWLLSKESFEKREINKLLSAKDEKINKPIDENILNDLLKIREWLSKELKAKKNYLKQEDIDEIVQILINRLIFIRSVEDMKLEPENFLLGLDSDVRQQRVKLQLFPYLISKFDEFNKKYDSKLFELGLLEKEGAFSEDVLHKVIRALYFGVEERQSRYMFDEIPGDLFGSIYEQYLGTILSGTEKRVKLEGGTGKRKKMGIYYTPSYIVDYIVKNTVGEYIKDKNIDEILKVKILDPACGSGSFLVRAFQEVCDKIEELLKKNNKSEKPTFKEYKGRLNLAQKITILLNCIYGVDLDEKAVELARLRLLLRILDGEGQETKKLLLPHLENNIKCGNSLIDDSNVSDKAFNWNAQFKDVFADGGFDVVVGNPPYGVNFSNLEKNYLKSKYPNSDIEIESYILFIEKVINSLIKKRGYNGFIIPSNILTNVRYQKIRNLILKSTFIEFIVDLGSNVFGDASVDSCILIIKKLDNKNKSIRAISLNKDNKSLILPNYKIINQNEFEKTPSNIFNIFSSFEDKNLIDKIEDNSETLDNFVNISRGIEFGYNSDLISDKKESEKYKPLIAGRCLSRYSIKFENKWLPFNEKDKKIYKDKSIYESEKILMRRIGHKVIADYDNQEYYNVCDVYNILSKGKLSLKLILAIINSELMTFYLPKKFKSVKQLFPKIPIENIEKFPIRLPSPPQEKKIVSFVNQMLELQKKYHDEKTAGNEKERLKQQIENTDYEIDEEIYKLYGITEEEKKVIEESLK